MVRRPRKPNHSAVRFRLIATDETTGEVLLDRRYGGSFVDPEDAMSIARLDIVTEIASRLPKKMSRKERFSAAWNLLRDTVTMQVRNC